MPNLTQSASLDWKVPRLIESAQESEESRKQRPAAHVDPQTVQLLNKESATIQKV